MVFVVNGVTYEEKLIEFGLEKRRWILNMVKAFKINRKVDDDVKTNKSFRLIHETRQQKARCTEGGLDI